MVITHRYLNLLACRGLPIDVGGKYWLCSISFEHGDQKNWHRVKTLFQMKDFVPLRLKEESYVVHGCVARFGPVHLARCRHSRQWEGKDGAEKDRPALHGPSSLSAYIIYIRLKVWIKNIMCCIHNSYKWGLRQHGLLASCIGIFASKNMSIQNVFHGQATNGIFIYKTIRNWVIKINSLNYRST